VLSGSATERVRGVLVWYKGRCKKGMRSEKQVLNKVFKHGSKNMTRIVIFLKEKIRYRSGLTF